MGAWQMADLGNAANWEPMAGEEGSQHKLVVDVRLQTLENQRRLALQSLMN